MSKIAFRHVVRWSRKPKRQRNFGRRRTMVGSDKSFFFFSNIISSTPLSIAIEYAKSHYYISYSVDNLSKQIAHINITISTFLTSVARQLQYKLAKQLCTTTVSSKRQLLCKALFIYLLLLSRYRNYTKGAIPVYALHLLNRGSATGQLIK